MYLLNEVYRKIMSEIHFVGKTRYEDLRETETETVSCHRLLRMARTDKEKNVKTKANFVNFQKCYTCKNHHKSYPDEID